MAIKFIAIKFMALQNNDYRIIIFFEWEIGHFFLSSLKWINKHEKDTIIQDLFFRPIIKKYIFLSKWEIDKFFCNSLIKINNNHDKIIIKDRCCGRECPLTWSLIQGLSVRPYRCTREAIGPVCVLLRTQLAFEAGSSVSVVISLRYRLFRHTCLVVTFLLVCVHSIDINFS